MRKRELRTSREHQEGSLPLRVHYKTLKPRDCSMLKTFFRDYEDEETNAWIDVFPRKIQAFDEFSRKNDEDILEKTTSRKNFQEDT